MQLYVRFLTDQLPQMAYLEEHAATDNSCLVSLSHNQLVPHAAAEQADQHRTRQQTRLLNKSFRNSSGYLCSIGKRRRAVQEDQIAPSYAHTAKASTS